MIKLNVVDFFDYNSKAVYEFLFLQGETEFEIIIPREYIVDGEDDYFVATDFINAGYAGHHLAQIAETFAYFVPSEFNKRPFYFEVVITDMEKFADTLYIIIQGLNYRDTPQMFLDFQTDAFQFLIDSYEDKIECLTWGLIHLATAYLE